VAEPGHRRHRLLPAADSMVRADHRGHLRGESDRFADVCRVRVVRGLGIVHAEQRHRGLQGAHRIRRLRHEPERLRDVAGHVAGGRQLHREAVELGRLRQLAVPQQIGDLLEGRQPRELVDVIAAVGQASVGAVQVTQSRLGGHDAFETANQSALFLGHGPAPPGVWSTGLDGIPVHGVSQARLSRDTTRYFFLPRSERSAGVSTGAP